MAGILTALGSIVTSVVGMVGDWVGVITEEGNELILFFVLFSFIGVGIGLLRRLINLN